MPSVYLLAFPGVQSLDVSGPLDVFAEANRFLLPQAHYRLQVIGAGPEPGASIACSNGMLLGAHRHFSQTDETADLLLVAGGPVLVKQAPDAALNAWLQRQAQATPCYGSICNGAFLLARAGLLDGKRATTHWDDAAALARQFPQIRLEPDRIWLRDGRLVTSAGVTAGIDLSLALLAEEAGAEVALNVAKRLVVFMQRSGGQSQFSPYLTPYAEEGSLVGRVQQYVLAHLDQKLTVEKLADLVAASPRNFARMFARDARMTPAEFIERARVDAARAMLERSALPLKSVAIGCGFRDAGHLRRVFQKRLGTSAQQYRDSFSPAPPAA
ncbi:GlxA family transcriptional regulator [Herbaspirillum sp. LeCh32-8]|uniref:GlxA family transcriptional regulator n=1 Tax=Herbaspirillum sp. LeCh32-8 TaxID=2821356 RepID=UPI001AE4BFF7|nr:GlxA family transcriptional regulator [Herbaspirillum sp. LeCh32-8]MBP0598957.1 GlxA family transcriptional regulator [Herbaspirillum sp. LeCh32-8]